MSLFCAHAFLPARFHRSGKIRMRFRAIGTRCRYALGVRLLILVGRCSARIPYDGPFFMCIFSLHVHWENSIRRPFLCVNSQGSRPLTRMNEKNVGECRFFCHFLEKLPLLFMRDKCDCVFGSPKKIKKIKTKTSCRGRYQYDRRNWNSFFTLVSGRD